METMMMDRLSQGSGGRPKHGAAQDRKKTNQTQWAL
jgi:hypothetical protein